jgi:adenylylsulfate kinase
MKILIMGLPGSGKTWLAERLQKHLNCAWFNADIVRKMANDWNFDRSSRTQQAYRMRNMADYEVGCGVTVICDFVCPSDEARLSFRPDITIWLDTISISRFDDTNKVFNEPSYCDIHIDNYLSDSEIKKLAERLKQRMK